VDAADNQFAAFHQRMAVVALADAEWEFVHD
jgi:hypothetical protein